MDADALYPQGFHPVLQSRVRDFSRRAWPFSRASAPSPVRYYFADFGISVRIPPGKTPQVLGHIGADREVPELSDTIPYDPFKVDIFILGNVLRKHIHNVCQPVRFLDGLTYMMPQKYSRVQFLGPLIKAMTHKNPKSRPTAEEAAEQWRQIRKRVLLFHRACRLRGYQENFLEAFVLDIISVLKVRPCVTVSELFLVLVQPHTSRA